MRFDVLGRVLRFHASPASNLNTMEKRINSINYFLCFSPSRLKTTKREIFTNLQILEALNFNKIFVKEFLNYYKVRLFTTN